MVVICLANRHLFFDDEKVLCDEKDRITSDQAKEIIPQRIKDLEKTINELKAELKKYENTFENESIAQEKFLEIQSKLKGIESSIEVMEAKVNKKSLNIIHLIKSTSKKYKQDIEDAKELLQDLYKEREETLKEYYELKEIWYNLSYNKNMFNQISEQLEENIQTYKEYKALLKAIDDPKGIGTKYHEMIKQRNRVKAAEEDFENYYFIAEQIIHFIDDLESSIDFVSGVKSHANLDPETSLLFPDLPWKENFLKILSLVDLSIRKRRKHLVETREALGDQLRVTKRDLLKIINTVSSMKVLKPEFSKKKINFSYINEEIVTLNDPNAEVNILLILEFGVEQLYRNILKKRVKESTRLLYEYVIPETNSFMTEFLEWHSKATDLLEKEKQKLVEIEKQVLS